SKNFFVVVVIFIIMQDRAHCPLGYFPCGNLSTCLPQLLHCNGVDDCGNQADEENCGDNNGWPHLFDNYFGIPSNNLGAKSNACLLGTVPAECQCRDLELDCDGAHFKDVPTVSINVTMMSLQRNRLRKLNADMFLMYQSLQKLYLQHNRIKAVHPRAFRGLYNLTRLYLSYNRITTLLPDVFQDLHNLEWLILENNNIHHISSLTFSGLRSLVLLVLLNNALTKLDDICLEMPRLNWLDVEGNKIETVGNVTFRSCNMLTVLVLQRNRISYIHEQAFSLLRKLGELDLSSNRIEVIPTDLFVNLGDLLQLNISYNPITDLRVDHFNKLHKLKSLSIEGIEIGNIHRKMFEPLKNLTHIYFKKFQYCGYAPHVRSCKPNTDGISSFEDLLANIVLRVFVWVVSATTCFGNIFVICMRSYIRSENKLHAMCIISLCYVATFTVHFYMNENKKIGMLLCEVTQVILFHYYIIFKKYYIILQCILLVLFYLYTYLMLLKPCSLLCSGLYISVWETSVQLSPIELAIYNVKNISFFQIGLNLVAFLIIVLSYGSMFYNIQRTGTQTTKYSNHIKKELTIAKRFFSIVITDSLCWIPIFILKILSLMEVEIPGTISSWVVIFILPINSALNPILYTLTTRPFKETLLQVWSNYRQRRPLLSSHPAHLPSFTWQEMWPLQENSQTQCTPDYLAHPSEMSNTTQLLPVEGSIGL
uniref:Relaxin family peptide receptor 1 n=1 Tax=Cyprinus carpio TaxID=7962 RepID=A0A8C1UXU3_CYPCA